MTDRPILFSGPMVRAILSGAKSQTRRIIPDGKVYDDISSEAAEDYEFRPGWEVFRYQDALCAAKVKHFVGDRLWVREAFSYDSLDVDRDGLLPPWYWADGDPASGDYTKPKPSIHMPRWASRLTMIVTDVRVERLNDISEEDVIAEGIIWENVIIGCHGDTGRHVEITAARYWHGAEDDDNEGRESAVDAYIDLWDHINGPGAWEDNPWVTVTSFEAHRQNIDQMVAA